ncbi:ABC transporter substrate-binding protein [Nitratireductor sp. StC3]|uniref:ABC transporter substrate-binding protein n=1 Tax=Nitratireductor sp. StC3 TaxID=2126741 RepID=UPI000D0CE216|nr:ABC transporter substrate-binding protein [Nitratireductor sp. StC3]PSM16366.1 peptide ABC transporter substrate-binding protein [Nitratireductor sp. StC3]
MNRDPSKSWNLSRRALLGGGAAAIASIGLPGLAGRAAAATPKRGGILRVGYSQGGTSDSLDPMSYFSDPQYAYGWMFGNNLVELAPDKSPMPELAESWEGSNGAKTWTFVLRKDVEFTNGKKLTAADVVYSLKRHMTDDSKSAAKGLLEGISDVRADGDHVVVVEHATGDADVPVILADFHLQIIPEGFNDWTTFIGSGPYILERFQPGVTLSARRNPNYWKPDRAWFDGIEFTFINDATARANALTTGAVDAADRIEPKIVNLIQRQPNLKLVETIGSTYVASCMDVREGPFDDNDVRQAVKYAIDREALVASAFSGFGEVGNDHPIASNDPFFNKDLAQRQYDPEKAKWHLKQAGLSSLDLELSAANSAFAGAVDSAVLMREQARAAGINLNVKREPDDGYWSNVWMKRPYFMTYWGVRPTPGMMFSLAFQCDAPWNESRWCGERFNQLLKAAQTELDAEKRRGMYQEMQALSHDEGGNCIFAFPAALDGYSDRVAGVEPDLVRTMFGSRLAERAWFAD